MLMSSFVGAREEHDDLLICLRASSFLTFILSSVPWSTEDNDLERFMFELTPSLPNFTMLFMDSTGEVVEASRELVENMRLQLANLDSLFIRTFVKSFTAAMQPCDRAAFVLSSDRNDSSALKQKSPSALSST